IYKHIKSRFRWNNYYGKYSDEGIKKALSKNSGNVGDINLSLVAAMNAANINAEPVILSTRDNGWVNKLFPVMSDFNYVVCKIDIGDSFFLLDATDPLLPFGLLPLRCINDQGRVMSNSKPSYWIDLKASQKEVRFYKINLTLEEDGKLKGNMELSYIGYEALEKRKKIKSFSSIDDYFENIEDNMPGMRILNADVKNLDELENTLTEQIEVEIDAFKNLDQERIFFNPFFLNKITENPFKLNERSYPVDWGAPSESFISVEIKFPENFMLQSKPEKVGVGLPGNGGKFLSEVTLDQSVLKMQQRIHFNKSIYDASEYYYLKELYNLIIKSQKFDVEFKKKI
nr:DUF3857 domain-containing protein [Bacteroidota bacterium]